MFHVRTKSNPPQSASEPRNPYAAPEARIEVTSSSGLFTATIIGFAIGNGLSFAAGQVAGQYFVWSLVADGVATNDLYQKFYEMDHYLAIGHLIAIVCMLIGGYWCARLSLSRGLLGCFFAGILMTLSTFVSFVTPYGNPTPLWSTLVSIVAPLPSFLVGGILWRSRQSGAAQTG